MIVTGIHRIVDKLREHPEAEARFGSASVSETLAWIGSEAAGDGFLRIDAGGTLDLLPLAQALLDARCAGYGAALFHATLVEALAAWAASAACRAGVGTIAFGGGCFLNAILSSGLRARLAADGFDVIESRQAPANDGGLALGQAWVARRALAARTNLTD